MKNYSLGLLVLFTMLSLLVLASCNREEPFRSNILGNNTLGEASSQALSIRSEIIHSNPKSLSCIEFLELSHRGELLNLSKLGELHNEYLDYLTTYEFQNAFDNTYTFFEEYSEAIAKFTVMANKNTSPYLDTTRQDVFLSGIYTLINSTLSNQIDEGLARSHILYDKGAISLQEKIFVDKIFKSFEDNQPLDHCALILEWQSIEKGIYDGLYSGAITSIYIYSTYYWQEFTIPVGIIFEDEDLVKELAWPLADLVSGAVGYADYMYDNWDDHWYDDFGMNALEAGGNAALDGSSFGLWSALGN